MKYIRHKTLGFLLFEGFVGHDEVARNFGGADEVLSAGFVFTCGDELKCLGYSGTLNINALASDGPELRARLKSI